VALDGGWLRVGLPPSKFPAGLEPTLRAWLRIQLREKALARLARLAPLLATHDLSCAEVRVLAMPGRWGSHTRAGRVLLHPDLAFFPVSVLDHILIHEHCHARHRNHGKAFRDLLRRICPDWKVNKLAFERRVQDLVLQGILSR
jgi:predicted metal-dependent hydrolase